MDFRVLGIVAGKVASADRYNGELLGCIAGWRVKLTRLSSARPSSSPTPVPSQGASLISHSDVLSISPCRLVAIFITPWHLLSADCSTPELSLRLPLLAASSFSAVVLIVCGLVFVAPSRAPPPAQPSLPAPEVFFLRRQQVFWICIDLMPLPIALPPLSPISTFLRNFQIYCISVVCDVFIISYTAYLLRSFSCLWCVYCFLYGISSALQFVSPAHQPKWCVHCFLYGISSPLRLLSPTSTQLSTSSCWSKFAFCRFNILHHELHCSTNNEEQSNNK